MAPNLFGRLCSAGKGTDEYQLSLVPMEPDKGVAIPRMRLGIVRDFIPPAATLPAFLIGEDEASVLALSMERAGSFAPVSCRHP